MKPIITALGLMLVMSSCTTHLAKFTAISTRPLPNQAINLNKLPQTKVTGSDTVFYPFLFSGITLSIEDSVNDALAKGKGDLLLDADLEVRMFYWVMGVVFNYSISGTVVNTQAAAQ